MTSSPRSFFVSNGFVNYRLLQEHKKEWRQVTHPSNVFETRCLHSLIKVFADEPLNAQPFHRGSALHNETYSFQVAYKADDMRKNVKARIESDIADSVTVRAVGLVPSEFPIYVDHDKNVLRDQPGLYPDPLFSLHKEGVPCLPEQWRSLWIKVQANEQMKPGVHPIQVVLETETGEQLGSETFELEIIPSALPAQRLIHTEWFHSDCIATSYGIPVFSEEHWQRIEQFVQTAARHGINMLLTPIFTPPLDTQIGGERPTVQLVDVEKAGDSYRFGFGKLQRWVEMSLRNGIEYLEFSHLFTQWGAKHAPKIVGSVNGRMKQIFGWETDAGGDEYRHFLTQFLPELVRFIKQNGLEKRSYFHVSDEPSMAHMEAYQNASTLIRELLSEFPIIDALSDYAFYEKGVVKNPIPANDHIEAFLENNVPDLWTYYCCVQYKGVANRFFVFPSARSRIIGLQLYKFRIAGFLQWGYNFWYSQNSIKPIDPYRVTDAGGSFPSGDAFVVYPGEDGPIESLRLEVFYEALQDLRALELLESKIGRESVLALLEEGLDQPITFSEYPSEAAWLLEKRELINRKIAEYAR
jgi:hypothetical protein